MSHTCSYANKLKKLACAILKGYSPFAFSSVAASLCPRGAGEREKRKRAGDDGHAFGARAPSEERARHVISRRVKTKTNRDYSVVNFLPKVK